jgi:hypothetical protein
MTTPSTRGIDYLIVETHNWGKSVAFWQSLGFALEFETDHHSGQLRHPAGGPHIFMLEVAADQPVEVTPVLAVADASQFAPPRSGTVEQGFVAQHWGVQEMMLRDPDGRRLSIQAPLVKDRAAPVAP